MKRILITGAGSYIGTSFEHFMSQWPQAYSVAVLDLTDAEWREHCFAGYDAVVHVAGLAHTKESQSNARLYYEINCDLVAETAQKAKKEGVRQFVFFSTMSVYGMDTGVITKDTRPAPRSHYGKSKLQAETALEKLAGADFQIAVLRPPMVYGKGCKGNFQSVVKLASRFPFFPSCRNRRSMIYIDNLCAFVKLVIDKGCAGLFFPQNRQPVSTSEMARLAALAMGREIRMDPVTGMAVRILRHCSRTGKKAFGNLIYDGLEAFDFEYCTVDFEESVARSI